MKLTTPFSPPIAFLTVAASLGVATVISSAAPASAISGPVTLGYTCILQSCPVSATQFSTVVSPVTPPGSLVATQALFTFTNVGSQASSITDISIFNVPQFSVSSVASVTSSTGVLFGAISTYSNPPNFPGGAFNQYYSMSVGPISTDPALASIAIQNGINPGGSLSVLFNIASGFNKPFNAVAANLYQQKLTTQIQAALPSSPSVRYTLTSNRPNAVPEPITMLGSAAALGFGALMKRRSFQLKSKQGLGTPIPATCETLA
jgi:hypothetical protein